MAPACERPASFDPARIPRTESEVALAADALHLPIPAPCLPGVLANLALLARHAETLTGALAI